MSTDDHPPQPGRAHRAVPLLAALLALLGVAMAVAGADTTVTEVSGAAPIVDDASRQEPSQYEHSSEDDITDSAPPLRVERPSLHVRPCTTSRGEAHQDEGCGPLTRRGPPGA